MSIQTIESTDTSVQTQTGSGSPLVRHYFRPPQDWPGNGQDFAAFCIVQHVEIVALCGTRWVPSTENTGLPVCQVCASIAADILLAGGGA